MSTVQLYCVKSGSKLRVRVSSEGYLRNANCQFPRDLRVNGRHYEVDATDISLITTRGKYFYAVKNRNAIRVIDSSAVTSTFTSTTSVSSGKGKKPDQVFTDETMEDCIVCMEKPKEIVFNCGHFYACAGCSSEMKQCPICRVTITARIKSSQFGTDD